MTVAAVAVVVAAAVAAVVVDDEVEVVVFWNDLAVTRLRTGEWSRPPAMIQAEGKTAN